MNNPDSSSKEWGEPSRGARFTAIELFRLLTFLKGKESLNRGHYVLEFERRLAEYLKIDHVVCATSCSASLFLVPRILGLKSSDEVLVPVNSFWTAVAPLIALGIRPVPYDVTGYDLNGDPSDAKTKITSKTKAIYVQSFGGSPYKAQVFRDLCDQNNLYLVEDSAHGLGAEYGNAKVQTFSDIACLSFSTLKNLVTLGEGGALVTKHKHLADRARLLIESRAIGEFRSEQTPTTEYQKLIEDVGYDFMRIGDAFSGSWENIENIGLTLRISAPQAFMGSLQLNRYRKTLMGRKKQCETYQKDLKVVVDGRASLLEDCDQSAHHLFNLRVSSLELRNNIISALYSKLKFRVVNRYLPIYRHSVSRFYNVPILEDSIYEEIFLNQLIALPIGPGVSLNQQRQIIECINEVE